MGQGQSAHDRSKEQSTLPGRSQTFEQMQELSIGLTKQLSEMESNSIHFVFETKQKQFGEFKFAPLWRSEVKVFVMKDKELVRELTFRQFNFMAAEILALLTSDSDSSPRLPLSRCSEKDADDDECPVCLDARAGVALGCGHRFCEDCITQWQHNETCPICRAGTKEDDLWILTDKPTGEDIVAHIRALVEGKCS